MGKLVSQSEFARIIGRDRARVTVWKKAGRLVMVDGLVDVEASQQRINATASPFPHHVASSESNAKSQNRPATVFSGEDAGQGMDTAEKIGLRQKYAQARKTEAEADIAVMEREEKSGRLLDADQARRHVSSLGITLRSTLESIPDRLAGPLSAETSPERVHAMLVEEIEQALKYAAEQIGKMGAAA